MEEKGFVLDLAEVDIKEVLKNALSFFEQKARDKGLALVLDIMTEVPAIQADRYRLEQLFINLLDNAVKYTEHGSIHITVKTQEKVLVIEIEDTGIGISEEHLPRIFERFYVADKSRSRKSGGTGLGLAIAKHIVHLHNGTITVTSTSGQGTKFTVTLPISRFPSV
jgi:two-component system phosphate regulon sensor histidine kinase PhoR